MLVLACFESHFNSSGASQVPLGVKNLPANARDVGSTPESGVSPEEGTATHSSVLT